MPEISSIFKNILPVRKISDEQRANQQEQALIKMSQPTPIEFNVPVTFDPIQEFHGPWIETEQNQYDPSKNTITNYGSQPIHYQILTQDQLNNGQGNNRTLKYVLPKPSGNEQSLNIIIDANYSSSEPVSVSIGNKDPNIPFDLKNRYTWEIDGEKYNINKTNDLLNMTEYSYSTTLSADTPTSFFTSGYRVDLMIAPQGKFLATVEKAS